ncbi:MAG: hypothetical protein K2I81_03180 [Alphaproteobacteria bacterium]|nr:hypothetical protein [Alphaproteobacteria bacterium]
MNFIPMSIMHKYLNWRDRHFPVGNILRHTQYVLVFKTTNYCDLQCPHCCENSGPHNPRTFIPTDIIFNYLKQAKADSAFSNNVVFTGGEITSAYRVGMTDYVPALLNKSLDLGIGTDIKTNAAWIRGELAPRILSDLNTISVNHKPYALHLSLSLDRYHKDALENNARLIAGLADRQIQVNTTGFENHVDMFPALIERIKSEKVSAEEVWIGTPENMRPAVLVGGKLLLTQSKGALFNSGRAQNMDWAKETEFPQFKFICESGVLVAFDSAGRVTLGENSGRKISTKWKTMLGPKSLIHTRADLIKAAWHEETRARLLEGWRFNQR